jgi:hypothetical protein
VTVALDPGTAVGTLGTGVLLLAFVLNVTGRIRVGPLYLGMNALGGAIAAYASFLIGFAPFVVLESVWCLAAIVRLVNLSASGRDRKPLEPGRNR